MTDPSTQTANDPGVAAPTATAEGAAEQKQGEQPGETPAQQGEPKSDEPDELPTADSFAVKLRGIAALPPVQREAKGWTDKAIAGAVALLTSLSPPRVDAADRVYRTCTMDFALDSGARLAIDRALEIADELGPRTDAAQINAIAERLRADGFADQVTTDGRLIVTGYAARTGSQLYGDGKSTWYEYRSEDEVEKSLKSFDYAPFTDDHPPVLVTADNWREYARGMLGVGAELLPPDEQGLRYVKVQICVGDIAVIRKMRDGKVQLSTGYTTVAVRDPGVDAQGIRYTYRQTDIQVNHQSLVDEARAGAKARVLIDGASVFEASKDDAMTTANTKTETNAAKPKTDSGAEQKKDQIDPEVASVLLAAIKSLLTGEIEPAGAYAKIGEVLGLDPAMVAEQLGGGVVVEVDGIKLLVGKDAAEKLAARERKINDAATQKAAADGELAGLRRQVEKLEADAALRAMDELEREIAPLCPQLVKAWADGKRPDSLTAMREAAILDLDPAAKVDLDTARGSVDKPAATFDAFVTSLYSSTKRLAAGRSKATATTDSRFPTPPAINTRGFHRKTDAPGN